MKMSVQTVSETGGVVGALPSALKFTGEAEGTIEFDVSYQLWMIGGVVRASIPAKLALWANGKHVALL